MFNYLIKMIIGIACDGKIIQQLDIAQGKLLQAQEQCEGYKIQVSSILQQYNDEVSQNKAMVSAANLEKSELQQHNQSLKVMKIHCIYYGHNYYT